VPLPSLYRHVRLLAENQILQAVDTVRVHGALTQVFAVAPGQTRIGPGDVAGATRADHLRYFTTFLHTLAESFRITLEQDEAAVDMAMVRSLMEPLYLSPEEFDAFVRALHAFLTPWREKTPGGPRRRLIFAHV